MEAEGKETYGLAVQITERELERLDAFEGSGYHRISLQIIDLSSADPAQPTILQGQAYQRVQHD